MASLSLITPTHGPDVDLFRLLHESVLRHADHSLVHTVVVPGHDLATFRAFGSARCEVVAEEDLLPAPFRSVARFDAGLRRRGPGALRRFPPIAAVNLRHPYPPVRGWMLQQLVKLAALARCPADVAVTVDSDIVFVRPLRPGDFLRDGTVRSYRAPGGVHAGMRRHVRWHTVARSLLGVEPCAPPQPDYVTSLLAWDPRLVRGMLARVEALGGRPALEVLGRQLDLSECTLYGTFVDLVAAEPARRFTSTDDLCHSYWSLAPLDHHSGAQFVATAGPGDVALLVQSKSGTPLDVRRAMAERMADGSAAA